MQMSSTPRSSQPNSVSPAMAMQVPFAAQERARGHLQRAQEQFKMKRYNEAVAELRDAIKNDPTQSEYHAWMAKVNLAKGLVGMAAISVRQALQINPKDALALECQKQVEAKSEQKQPTKTEKPGLGGLLSRKLF
jgi:Tfp pilus assembly protein PilF